MDKALKWLNDRVLGHLMFLALFVLAIVFYLERTVFVDPCYAVFNVMYFKDFVVEAGRYAAVLPQTLILLAMKLNLPLKAVLMAYSLSFILLYYLLYLLIAYGFKLERIALAVPLLFMIGVKYSFYWISTETQQALVYTVLFYAFLVWSEGLSKGIATWLLRLILGTGILLLCFYTHPIALFTVLFVLGFYMTENKAWLKPDGYVLGGVIVALGLMKYLTSSPAGYEHEYFSGFADFFHRIGHVFKSGSFQFLRAKLFNIYLFSMVLLLVTTAWYIYHRNFLKLAYYLGSLVVIALVLFTTFEIHFLPFIQEKNLMGLNVFLLIPFLKDVVFSSPTKRLIRKGILVLICITGILHVSVASTYCNNRLAYIRTLIGATRSYSEKKFLIQEPVLESARLDVNWALATETLILSSLPGPDSSVTIYVNDHDGVIGEDVDLNDSLLFICTPWAKNLEIQRLNKRYFNLDRSTYRELEDVGRGLNIRDSPKK